MFSNYCLSFRELCPNIDEDMQSALSTSTIVPATPSLERPRGPMQMVHLFVLNPEKKSQPRLSKLARTLGFKLVSTYSSQVTHLTIRLEEPVNSIKSNPNFYSAVLQGHFIVDFKCMYLGDRFTNNCHSINFFFTNLQYFIQG